MAYTVTGLVGRILKGIFASSEEKRARRKQRVEARKNRRASAIKAAKELRENGCFDDHISEINYYRHYYF